MVWSTAVWKNVYEQEAIRLQPRGNIPKKLLVVLHVLHHCNKKSSEVNKTVFKFKTFWFSCQDPKCQPETQEDRWLTSNISIHNMRSNFLSMLKVFMSQVITVTFDRPCFLQNQHPLRTPSWFTFSSTNHTRNFSSFTSMWCEGGDQALFTTARSSKEISHQLATKNYNMNYPTYPIYCYGSGWRQFLSSNVYIWFHVWPEHLLMQTI